jgi:hypothetical protein
MGTVALLGPRAGVRARQRSVVVWATLGVVALGSLVLYLWRRKVEAARERAWVGSFSFGDVIARMRAREAAHGFSSTR